MINDLFNNYHIDKSVVLWLATNIIAHTEHSHYQHDTSHQSHDSSSHKHDQNVDKHHYCTWEFNINTINDLFDNYKDTDMWDVLEKYNGNSTIHFIRAGLSVLLDCYIYIIQYKLSD